MLYLFDLPFAASGGNPKHTQIVELSLLTDNHPTRMFRRDGLPFRAVHPLGFFEESEPIEKNELMGFHLVEASVTQSDTLFWLN